MNFTPLILLLLGFVPGRCSFIRKCCDKEQQLNFDFNSCVDFDGNKGLERYETNRTHDRSGVNFVKLGERDAHHIWWLPPEIQFLSADQKYGTALKPLPVADVTDVRFVFNGTYPCANADRAVVPFKDNVFLLDDGSLLMAGLDDNLGPETMIFDYTTYCLDRVSRIETRRKRSWHTLDHSFAILLCPCRTLPCVRTCCSRKCYLDVSGVDERCQYEPKISTRWVLNYADYDGKTTDRGKGHSVVQGLPKCDNYFYLNDNSSSNLSKFWILPNGNARIEGHPGDIDTMDYCMHYTNINGSFRINLRYCVRPADRNSVARDFFYNASRKHPPFQDVLYETYFVTGAFFLGLTLVVYAVLPEIRKTTYAHIVMCHVGCLFVCYVTMAFDKIGHPVHLTWTCRLTGYVIQSSFLSGILWLNVMCLHISRTFRRKNLFRSSARLNNNKHTFLVYSLYVWGVTAVIFLVTFFADRTPLVSAELRPKLGIIRCWLSEFLPQFIYFYLPVTIALLFNLILFLFTAKGIRNHHRQSKKMLNREGQKHIGRNPVTEHSSRLSLYGKLFALMGVTWIFEVLSWAIGGQDYYWYFTDAVNSLRGVFVFAVCCCKKDVLVLLSNRLLDEPKNSSTGASQSGDAATSSGTRRTSIQMIIFKNACSNSNSATGSE